MVADRSTEVTLDGHSLTVEEVVVIAKGYQKNGELFYPEVKIAKDALENLQKVREFIEKNWLVEDAPAIYGFNTGVGKLKDSRISILENDKFQKLIIESHCAGIGEPAPEDVVRATMVMRANALVKGVSGIRPEVVERLLLMLNRKVHPVIPQQGSVGASGDLPALAHLVSVLVGHPEAEAYYDGKKISAQDALQSAEILPVTFKMLAKDVLAMINGCTFTLGFCCLAFQEADEILDLASIACALSMEAMRGEMAAFDPRIQEVRNHPGQIQSAEKIRDLLHDSQWVTEDARKIKLPYERREGEFKPRVQDSYALRCVPQVHGASLDTFQFVKEILEREMNAATDNPLVFPKEDGEYEMLSGGNFHGEHLAFAMDFLTVAVHEIGNISERRSARLLDPTLSYGLPPNLVGGKVGLNTGFALAQCAASSMVSENKAMCFPLGADSIPTKSNQEDHVSMATASSRRVHKVIENVQKIIAIEILCACQGISYVEPYLQGLKRSSQTEKVYQKIRKKIPATGEDRYIHGQMKKIVEMVENKEICR